MTRLTLEGGGHASVRATQGDAARLTASRAFPPGATLVGTAEATLPEFRVKVRGSKLDPADASEPYVVTGRWVSLTRAQRRHLEASAERAP